MPLRVKRTITVKAVVTDELKASLGAELQGALGQVEKELARLEAGPRRILTAQAPAADQGEPAAELRHRRQQKEGILARLRELAKLEPGAEIVQGTVKGDVEVRLGDDWERLFRTEIVLKDGKVVALRE